MTESEQPWDGFLRRQTRAQHPSLAGSFAGRRVLITGAGGYIGSAIACALSAYQPAQLVFLDAAEHGLYTLQQQLSDSGRLSRCEFVVGNICDGSLVRELFNRHRPEVVFHAAALKHVPLMESNPFAAAEINALGTRTVAKAARDACVDRLVLLSTDKAVDPVSIMGASKRVAELIVLADRSATRMHAVRLGNVLGSSGSVAPLFVAQIARGGPVTVTHPQASRYFLSLADTVECLLLAAAGEQQSGLLIPAVDQPYRIDDLARFLISRYAISGPPVDIVYTGLRPGDKLHERMTSSRERVSSGIGELLSVEDPRLPADRLLAALDRMSAAIQTRDVQQLLLSILDVVPEYIPDERLQARGNHLAMRAR